jgi:hypothetical protein
MDVRIPELDGLEVTPRTCARWAAAEPIRPEKPADGLARSRSLVDAAEPAT